MSDRPILFSGPMVRALLDGRKTQTRRVIKPQPTYIESSGRWRWPIPKSKQHGCDAVVTASREWHEYLLRHQRPWAATGDRLWVKETWTEGWETEDEAWPIYAAEYGERNDPVYKCLKPWHSSMFMPRKYSRITLTVTDVRVQRLQGITLGDICAEGLARSIYDFKPATDGFRVWQELWDSLNAKRGFGWDANPWVAAYSFTVEHGNIDARAA